MAICCPKSIKACALRITRLGASDAPLDPLTPNSRIQTAGFMELQLTPDLLQGDVLEIANQCGDICITDRGCDRLKGFNLQLRLCGVPLTVLEMLVGATLLDDGSGNFVGGALRETKSVYCSDNKMLELWTKNADRGACDVDGNPTDLYIHWLLPRTLKWEISGPLTFNSGVMEITLSGYAENNPNFYPSFPGDAFPAYSPGGGDPDGLPTNTSASPVLPVGVEADPWSVSDQAAIQGSGPLAWRCVAALPSPIDDCDYVPSDAVTEPPVADDDLDSLWYAADASGDPAQFIIDGSWPDARGANDWIDWVTPLGAGYFRPTYTAINGRPAWDFSWPTIKEQTVAGPTGVAPVAQPYDMMMVVAVADVLDGSPLQGALIGGSDAGTATDNAMAISVTDDTVTSTSTVYLSNGDFSSFTGAPAGSFPLSERASYVTPFTYIRWVLVWMRYDGASSWVEIDGTQYALPATPAAAAFQNYLLFGQGARAYTAIAVAGWGTNIASYDAAFRQSWLDWKNANYPNGAV